MMEQNANTVLSQVTDETKDSPSHSQVTEVAGRDSANLENSGYLFGIRPDNISLRDTPHVEHLHNSNNNT